MPEQPSAGVRGGRQHGSVQRPLVLAAAVALAALLATAVLAAGAVRAPGPPAVASLRLDPPAVEGCLPAQATVVLDRAASEGGLDVSLGASTAAADVPAQITVPAGADRRSFPVATSPVAVGDRAELRAGAGNATVTADLQIVPVRAATVAADPPPACLAGFTDHHGYADPERTGAFDAGRIPEASGLAASRRNPGWLYLVDDQEPTEIWAVRPDGSGLQPIPIEGFVGRDTEDLAVGPCGPHDPTPCVYVGDIGDNLSSHPDVAILRFAEPDLSGPVAPVIPATIRVRYPDGPADAETLLVDDAATPYIVTKETREDGASAARLFAAPGFADGELTPLGPVPVPEPARPLAAGFVGLAVTGGDYRDGRVALRTYDSVVEYVAPDPAAPLAELPSWPSREVPSARQPQSEAVGWVADGCGYVTASEQVGDLWLTACRR